MPVKYTIENDRVFQHGEVEKLGVPYPNSGLESISKQLFNGDCFPFTRCCFSIGDWGIISALPEIFKKKYSNLQFYIPKPNWIRSVFPNSNSWTYKGNDPAASVELVFANNPFVKWFDVNELSSVFCDHERCQRFENEPLAEQIARYFGFTEEEILEYDFRPKLYFTKEERELGDSIIEKYMGKECLRILDKCPFDCLLFASRLEHLNNLWPRDYRSIHNLLKQIGYNDRCFYYSAFNIKESYWMSENGYENLVNFADIPEATLRIQWYIKSKADRNISYQSGFNDTVASYSKHHVATHRIGTGETTVRGVTYYQNDGAIIKY